MRRRECRELSILLVDYLDGRLSRSVSIKIEKHIKECCECEEFFERYRECIEALRDLEIDVPDDLEVKLFRLIEEIKRR